MFIKWSDSLVIGIEIIDSQHKSLIRLINRIYDFSLDKNFPISDFDPMLNELIEYVRTHFTTEENFFNECSYSGKEEHISEHIKYIEKVLDFKTRFDSGENIIEELLIFLRGWTEDHIRVVDHKYIKELKACGLK